MSKDIFTELESIVSPHTPRWGWARLERPFSVELYRDWIKNGFHGSMAYLKDGEQSRLEPQTLVPEARSAIVVGYDYIPHPEPSPRVPQHLKVARYARGRDYHYWLRGKLNGLAQDLQAHYPSETFVVFADTAPILERDLAVRAGLGWIGKNTCVIDQNRGSFFLVGEIYTSLDSQATLNIPADRCGTCTRCLDACPTGALIAPRVLDARKCISYLTIENREDPTPQLRDKFSGWYFGCDICQDVCPWNGKILKSETPTAPARDDVISEIREILTSSNKKLDNRFKGTALSRARAWMHKRNAIIYATHKNFLELRGDILNCQRESQLQAIVSWSIKQLEVVS